MKRNKKIMYGIFGVVAAIVAIFSLSMFVFKNENPNHNSSEQNEVFVEAVKNTTDGNVTIEIADTSFSGAGTLLRVEKHENVIVSNCTFDGATDSAIIVDGGKLSIGGNSVITNCAGANVICLESGTNSELKIENSTISNNSSGYVICASGIVGEVNVNDSIIKDNSGSVIFIDDFGGLGVRFGATSSTFENNGDTMFRFCDTTATFTDCVIDGKESSEEGISIESSVEKSQDYSSSYMSTLTLLGNTQIKNFTGLGVNATLTQLYFGTESQQFTGEISGNAGGGVLGLECYGSMNGGKISGNLGIGGIKLLDYECCYSFVDSTMSSYIETYFSFKDAEISNNTSTTNGGGIYCEGSLVLENTTVSQNEASTLGGGIFVTKDELRKSPVIVSIDESSVSGNKLTTTVEKAAFGGGLAFGSVTATIKDSFVSGNTSTYRGGGIYVGGATLDIVGTTVVCENSAEKEGSGLAASSGNVNLGTSNEVLSGGFAENSGGNTGAAINLSNATMNFNSGTIGAFGDYGGNSTTNGSGAVTVYTNSTFNMNGGLISGNTSAGGGAVTVSKSSTGRKSVFNFKAGTIKDNTNSNGNKNCGAVYVGDGCEFNMTSAGAVIENTSSTFGRAIYNLGTTNIINGIMKNCGLGAESSLYGGYIYNNGTLELSGGTIGEDSATANKHSYQGGAIFNAVNGSFSMSGGTIKNVSASNSGGAIYNVGTLSVTGGAIQGASAAANGGAIATTNKMGTFTGMNISGCSALRGGAIFVQGTEASPVEIVLGKNVKIRGNTAVNSGGGVYGKFAKINVAGATIESNTFTIERSDNASTTTNFGGAIDAEISEITIGSGVISNHVFEHSNVRGAAVSARNGTTFTMSGGTISGNITTHDNDQSWGGGLWSTGTYKKSNGSVVVGHVTITGGTFENNESYYGGAIRVLSNTSNTAEYATVTVTGGNFVGNIAHDYGAAFGVARVNMTFGGTANIDGNTMTLKDGCADNAGNGAGININKGTLTISGGTIQNNVIAADLVGKRTFGAGVYLTGDATLEITGGVIQNNKVNVEGGTGGNVFLRDGCSLEMSGGTISGGQATHGGGIAGLCEMTISGGTISGNTATYGAGIMSSHDVTLAGQPTIADQILLAATIFEETTSVNYPKINVRKTLVSSGTVIPVSLMEALHDADSLKFEVKAFETESFDDVDAHYYDKGHAVVSHVDGGLGMGSSGFQMAGGKAFYPLMSVADNYYAHAVTPNYYNTTIKNKAGSNLNSNIIVPENSKIVDNGDTIEVHYDYYQMIPTTNADGSTSYSESNKKTYVRSIRKAPTVSDFVFKDWYFGSSSTTLGTKIDTTIEVGELSGASNRYILPKYHQLFDIKIQHTVIFSGTLAAPTNYRVLKTETISDVEQTSAVYIYSAVGADSRDRIYQMTTTDPDTGVEGEKFLVSKENYVPSVMHYGVILSTGTSRYNGTKLTRTSSLSSDLTITVAYFNYVAMDENSYAYLNDAVTYPEDLYWSPNVVIPDAWFNDTVGVVDAVRGVAANGFQNCTFIENLTYAVDSNSGVSPVEVIGASAFEGCTNLKNIEIPEKVHSIGSRAFYNCSNVTTLNYNAKGVTDFARTNMIFSGLGASSDGVTINVGSYVVSIPYSFMNSSSSSYVKPKVTTLNITGADNLTTIKQFSFGNISTLTGNLYLPESLVTIGSNSFQYTKITGFDNLASSIVKRIANNSFAGCTSLSGELIFPSTLETLNNGAFSGCSGITKIDLSACTALSTLGDSLTVAGSCFNGCTNVSELKLNTSLLGDYSSNNTRFSGIGTGVSGGCKVYLGDAMTRVPAHLFSSCTGISSISFGSNIESIGGYAFYDNSSIVTLNLSGALKLTSIENSAFYRCNKITGTLNLSNVTNLGFSVFQYCSSITEVTLSSSLTVIPSYCFSGCSSISSIKIPTTVATIEECAFAACGLTELEIPNNVTSMGCGAFGDCTRLTNLTIGTGISYLETGSSASDYPAQFYGCTELEEITVYSTELSLRKKMFGGCAKLKTLVTLSGIASGGFSGLTYLETVEIYGVDYSIGENAFDSCTGLKSVWIASSGSGMGLTIGNLAFNGCYNLEKITFDGTRYDISGTGIISYIIVHTNSEAKNESPFWGCTKLTLYAHNIGFDTDSDWENNGYSSVTFIANDDKWKYVSDSKKVQGIN